MKKVIIYGSHYGTTKRYAEKLAEMTGISVISSEAVKDLSVYGEVIHFGGLYAGGVNGLKNTVKLLPNNAKLIIVTVGLADVTKQENTEHIKKAISQQISKDIFDKAQILHLRGGIDYSRLSFVHKMMMSFLYKKIKNTPEKQQTQEERELIQTYNQKVDFVDFSSLQKIVDTL